MYTDQDQNYIEFFLGEEANIKLLFAGRRENCYHWVRRHIVKNCLLVFVSSGKAKLYNSSSPKTAIPIEENDMFVLYQQDNQQWYETEPDLPWSVQWLALSQPHIFSFLSKIGMSPENPVLKMKHFSSIQTRIEKIIAALQCGTYVESLECQVHLYHILKHIYESSGHIESGDYVEKAIRIIQSSYENDLSLERIANLLNIDKCYLSRLFQKERHETVLSFLTNYRLNESENLLTETDLSMHDIAVLCGFSDEFYFSRVYKKHRGIPPSVFRALNRKAR